MMKILRYLISALAIVFAITTIVGYIGYLPYQEGVYDAIHGTSYSSNDDNDEEAEEDSGDDSNWMYPSISLTKEDKSYWTDRYTKEGYRFFFGNNDRAGITTKDWLKEVQTEAKKYMKQTERKGGDEAEFNEFVHNALKAREVAALEEFEQGKTYSNGRDMYIFFDDNGDTKVLPVTTDDTEFDFENAEYPYDVLERPEETVPASEVKSLWQQAQELINASQAKEEPVVEQAIETPVVQTPAAAPAAQQVVQTPAPAPVEQTVKSTQVSFEPTGSSSSGSKASGSSSGTTSSGTVKSTKVSFG